MDENAIRQYLQNNLRIFADIEEIYGNKQLIIKLFVSGEEVNYTTIWL